MSAGLERRGDTLSLNGSIDFTNARALQAELSAAVASSKGALQLDFSAVERTNSAGLSLLLSAARAASAAGLELRFVALPEQLRSMAAVCGLDEWLTAQQQASPRTPTGEP